MYYGVLQEILELHFTDRLSVVLFRCKWYKSDRRHILQEKNIINIDISSEAYKDDQFILATQARQIFYTDDPSRSPNWRVVHEVHHTVDISPLTEVLTEVDLLHSDNSSHFSLFVDLGNLENVELHQDSMPPDHVIETSIPSFSGDAPFDMYSDDDMEDDTVDEYENIEREDQVGDEPSDDMLTEYSDSD
ncbi:Unknown protein [Striga hermonthica]|uniref:DUF4216 domain-containing protein n=1 Tax=Striga hermonthica TaxID=68872 RepID=A0A9N7N1V0_STRHE|nr:Unknown protein [Striga hermonthica]